MPRESIRGDQEALETRRVWDTCPLGLFIRLGRSGRYFEGAFRHPFFDAPDGSRYFRATRRLVLLFSQTRVMTVFHLFFFLFVASTRGFSATRIADSSDPTISRLPPPSSHPQWVGEICLIPESPFDRLEKCQSGVPIQCASLFSFVSDGL